MLVSMYDYALHLVQLGTTSTPAKLSPAHQKNNTPKRSGNGDETDT